MESPIQKVKMIINPTAGHGKGRKELEHVLRVFRSYNIAVDLAVTEYHEHAVELAEESHVEEYDALVAAGGDGTVYHVINGLMRHPTGARKPLGIIPLGTGNAGAWDTAGVRDIDTAVKTIAETKTHLVDVGTFLMDHQTYYFLNVIGVGFVADVGQIAMKLKSLGEMAYTLGVLWEIFFLKSHHMRFEVNGDQFDLDGTFVEFCNTRYTAADMLMAPDAEIDDGLIDMVVCKSMNRRRLLTAFPKVFKGTHTEMDEIEVHKIKSVKLWTEEPKVLIPDGEIFGRTPIEVSIQPRALEIFYRESA